MKRLPTFLSITKNKHLNTLLLSQSNKLVKPTSKNYIIWCLYNKEKQIIVSTPIPKTFSFEKPEAPIMKLTQQNKYNLKCA